jgi:hypothetical protein
LDETSDILLVSQVAIVLRYIDGKIQERFIAFTDVNADRRSYCLSSRVPNVTTQHNNPEDSHFLEVNYSNKVNLTWVEDGQNEKCIQNVSQKT